MNCPCCNEFKDTGLGNLTRHIRHQHTDYDKAMTEEDRRLANLGLTTWQRKELLKPIRMKYDVKVNGIMKNKGLIKE